MLRRLNYTNRVRIRRSDIHVSLKNEGDHDSFDADLTAVKEYKLPQDALVFVEVLMPNRETTVAQLARLGYVFRQSFQRYKRCINLIFAKS